MKKNIETGNAIFSGENNRQWFVGKFIEDKLSLRQTEDIEIKWSNFKSGDKRDKWAKSKFASTISILISGKIETFFSNEKHIMIKPGDYIIWGPNVVHRWQVLEDSTVITIRWPSDPKNIIEK